MKLKILSDLKFSDFEKSVFFLLFCFILSFTVIAKKIQSEPTFYDKKISQADRATDINLLLEYMENTYAGRFLYQKEYEDLKSALNKYKNESDQPITIWRFEKDIRWILRSFADGHLNVSRVKYEKYRQRAFAPQRVISHEFKTINNKKILTIKIPTFLVSVYSELDETVDLLKNNLQKIDYLIFDLSGNSGGYMAFPYRIAATIWGTNYRSGKSIQLYPTPYKQEFKFLNTYSVNLFKTYDQRNGLEEFHFFSKKAATAEQEIEEINPNNQQLQDINTYYDFTKPSQVKAPHYPQRIFIVTDYSCASSCEKLIEALEFHPRVTHLGQSTKGSTQFSSIGWLQLPKSNLVVNIPTGAIEYYDNRKVEGVGYNPKLNVHPGDNGLLETVYLYIEKNYK